MPKITQESYLSELAQQKETHTVFRRKKKNDRTQILVQLLKSAEHTYVLEPSLKTKTQAELASSYTRLLSHILELLFEPNEFELLLAFIEKQAAHELAHYQAVQELLTISQEKNSSMYDGKIAALLAVIIKHGAGGIVIQPQCVLKISDELSLDERLFALATIIVAPYNVHHEEADLSPDDKAQLRNIIKQVSDQTPLTNKLSWKIDEILNPDLHRFDDPFNPR